MAATMQELANEMMKAGVVEEMLNDGLDTALHNEDMEEIEEEVDEVSERLALETTAQLPTTAARRERIRPSTQSERQLASEGSSNWTSVIEGGLRNWVVEAGDLYQFRRNGVSPRSMLQAFVKFGFVVGSLYRVG